MVEWCYHGTKRPRNVVEVDRDKCDAAGCASPRAMRAIEIVDGKQCFQEIYCDGLGNCIGKCRETRYALS